MKIGELRQMKTDELHSELDNLRRRVFELRSQAVTEKLQDATMVVKTRRHIARILTVLQQRGERGIEEKQMHLEAEGVGRRSQKRKKKD